MPERSGPRPPRIPAARSRTRTPWAGRSDDDDLEDVDLDGVDLGEEDLTRARIVGTVLQACVGAAVRASRSSWRDVRVDGCRIGSLEAYETEWRGVTVVGTKIDYVNARASQWRDVSFEQCQVGELDLTDAAVERMRLGGCTVGTLVVGHARLTDVDLRGARIEVVEGFTGLRGSWLTLDQLSLLAPALAAALGISIAD